MENSKSVILQVVAVAYEKWLHLEVRLWLVVKHGFFILLQVLFELILFTLCPEVVSEEVKQRARIMMNRTQQSTLPE